MWNMWKLTGLLSRVASTESLGAGEGGCGEHHSRGGSQPGEHVACGSRLIVVVRS